MCTWPTVCQNQSFGGERVFFFIIITLNLAAFSLGGSGVLCSSVVEHLHTVKASCSRNGISMAAGLCTLCSCRSSLPGGEVEGMGLGGGERLEHRGRKGALGPGRQGPVCVPLTRTRARSHFSSGIDLC